MATAYSSLIPKIKEALPSVKSLNALLGFDGTVDVICKPVESRQDIGKNFTAFKKMRDFGQRVVDADGKSAMIEIVNELQKIGGNGPIMANALAEPGLSVDYIGPLGTPETHPVYEEFCQRIQVHSVAQPAVTHALEFPNGKLMLTSISSYEGIDADALQKAIGETEMIQLIQRSQLCCLLNWTCLPGLESILSWYLDTLLPKVAHEPERIFFFDLADPSMRSEKELMGILNLISKFEAFGRTVLGMNLNEAQQVCRTLQLAEPESEQDSLRQALSSIRDRLNIHTAMAHPTDFAACATAEGSWAVTGPYTESPAITTGAGDHLNAGFCLAQLLDFSPEDSLSLGVLFSGYYVRKAKPPTLEKIIQFIETSLT